MASEIHKATHRVKPRRLLDVLLMLGVTIGTHLILKLPIRQTPMYGDDFLGIRVAQMPIRSGSILENIWLVGGGKWRPITTSLLLFLGQKWGYSYASFQILNSVLLVLVAMTAGIICLRMTNCLTPSLLTAAAITSSQFNWFSQISIYGCMELLAILFLLGAISGLMSLRSDSVNAESRINMAVFLLLAATLCHERYIVCSVIFVGYLVIWQRNMSIVIRTWKPLIIPVFHVLVKAFVLQVDPLNGGGESNFRESVGTWIISHFFDAIKMLTGWFSGAGHFYNQDQLGTLAEQKSLGIIGPAVLTIAVLIILGFMIPQIRRRGQLGTTATSGSQFLLLGLALSCLIPAASVVQRIEARWLFASQILILLASTTGVCAVMKSRRSFAGSVLPAAFLCLGVAYLPSSDSFTVLRDQPTMVLDLLSERAPTNGPWSLVITQSDRDVSTEWQFGYGDALSQLPNPPYFANISRDPRAGCVHGWTKVRCFRVTLDALDIVQINEEVSSLMSGDR